MVNEIYIPDAWEILRGITEDKKSVRSEIAANLAKTLVDHYVASPASVHGGQIEIKVKARQLELPGLVLWLSKTRFAIDKQVLDEVRAILRRKHWVVEMPLGTYWMSRLYGGPGLIRMYPVPRRRLLPMVFFDR